MNGNQKELLMGFLRSYAGLTVGYLVYLFFAQLVFYGFGAAFSLLNPVVLIGVIIGTVFSIWNFMFAVFFTMFVVQRRGITSQEVWYWVGISALFSAVMGMLSPGFGFQSLVALIAQIAAMTWGAHFAHRIKV